MRFIIFLLALVTIYTVIIHISSGDGITLNWLLGYGLFCSPFILLLLSSIIVKPWVVKIYAGISGFTVLTGALLIITNNEQYILPGIAWGLLVFSFIALVVSAVLKGITYAASRNTIT